jgi:hypothetical protein
MCPQLFAFLRLEGLDRLEEGGGGVLAEGLQSHLYSVGISYPP